MTQAPWLRALALSNLLRDLVDLVGIEPTTSSMPWNAANRNLADGKGFNSRTSRQKPLKSACFATKMLPKHVLPICYQTNLGRGLTAGDSPFLKSIMATAALFAWRARMFTLSLILNIAFLRGAFLQMVVVSDARQRNSRGHLWRFKTRRGPRLGSG